LMTQLPRNSLPAKFPFGGQLDDLTRQAILHLYLTICGYFALKIFIPRPLGLGAVIGNWVKKRCVTTTQKLHKLRIELVGSDPLSGLVIGVCNSRCGSQVKLTNLRLREKEVTPASCEHCYRCGRLLLGGSERGCLLHLKSKKLRLNRCPKVDWTSTELFQMTLLIIAKQSDISEQVWATTRRMVEVYPFKEPSFVANLVRKQLNR